MRSATRTRPKELARIFGSDPAAGAWHGDCEIKIWKIVCVARCAWQGRHAAKDRRDAVEGGSRGDPRHQGAAVSCSAKTSSHFVITTYFDEDRTILNTCRRNISCALEKSDGGRRAALEVGKLGAALELRSSAAPRIGALQGTASLSFKSTGTLATPRRWRAARPRLERLCTDPNCRKNAFGEWEYLIRGAAGVLSRKPAALL